MLLLERKNPVIFTREMLDALLPGHYVYRCYDAAGQLLYVGQSTNVLRRLGQHMTKLWWPEVERIEVTSHTSAHAANVAERRSQPDAIFNQVGNPNRDAALTYKPRQVAV